LTLMRSSPMMKELHLRRKRRTSSQIAAATVTAIRASFLKMLRRSRSSSRVSSIKSRTHRTRRRVSQRLALKKKLKIKRKKVGLQLPTTMMTRVWHPFLRRTTKKTKRIKRSFPRDLAKREALDKLTGAAPTKEQVHRSVKIDEKPLN